jgi:hypothetical protein
MHPPGRRTTRPHLPCEYLTAPVRGAVLVVALVVAYPLDAFAQAPLRTRSASPALASEEGARWQDLTVAQRNALKPLESSWSKTDAPRKQKWLEIAARFPSLPAAEQARIQNRMAEWSSLTPEQRGQARLNFQDAKQAAPLDRQAQWEAYQSLSPEEKRKLAARANRTHTPTTATTSRSADTSRRIDRTALAADGKDRAARDSATLGKSNIVPNPAHAAPARRITPTVVQAQPGATTSVMSRRAEPPPHQQTGLPKIAASPNFVDKSTLLPRRGPQGAATRSAAASAPEPTVRR